MEQITIYHNPQCSKSRQTLQILQEKNADVTIRNYQEEPLAKQEIKKLLEKLNMKPSELVRTNEEEYKKTVIKNGEKKLNEEKILELLVRYPRTIQRPIVEKGNKAILGRPPENVLQLLT